MIKLLILRVHESENSASLFKINAERIANLTGIRFLNPVKLIVILSGINGNSPKRLFVARAARRGNEKETERERGKRERVSAARVAFIQKSYILNVLVLENGLLLAKAPHFLNLERVEGEGERAAWRNSTAFTFVVIIGECKLEQFSFGEARCRE